MVVGPLLIRLVVSKLDLGTPPAPTIVSAERIAMKAEDQPTPKYLPQIVADGETSLPEITIETLAFVLSGIGSTVREV